VRSRRLYATGIDVSTTGAKALLIGERGDVASATEEYPSTRPTLSGVSRIPKTGQGMGTQRERRAMSTPRAPTGHLRDWAHRADAWLSSARQTRFGSATGDPVERSTYWPQCVEITMGGRHRRPTSVDGQPGPSRLHRTQNRLGARNEPSTYERVAHILLPKDYIRFRLTGEFATDVSDAPGTLS
jgi:xylulokinase